jgi:hypothetical protein
MRVLVVFALLVATLLAAGIVDATPSAGIDAQLVAPAAAPGASAVTGTTPFRVLDTRSDLPSIPDWGATVNLPLAGVGPIPADGSVTAAVLNVVGTEARAEAWTVAYPHGEPRPATSSLNVAPGQTQAAQVVVPIGDDGSVDLYVSAPVHLVADVVGYYRATDGPVAAGRTEAVGPIRVRDTRDTGSRLAPGAALDVDLTGRVPNDATAAVLTVTGVDSSNSGFLNVRPAGTPYAGTSTLNFDESGDVVANQVLAQLSSTKKLTVQSFNASSDVVVDVTGYVTGASAPATERGLFVATSGRAVDTRDVAGPVIGRTTVDTTGIGGVPATGVSGVAVNVTLTRTSTALWGAAIPVGTAAGQTSTVNATRAGQTVAAPGTVFGGTDLDVAFSAPTEAIVDVTGWYLSGTDPQPTAVVHRVNAGGAPLGGTPTWSADSADDPSPYRTSSASLGSVGTTIDTTDPSVPAGTPAELFQTERFKSGGGPLTWSFPVDPGQYVVRLYFAETWFSTDGSRVFDVAIEGATVLDDLDVHATAGGANRGVVRSFTVTADSDVDIAFSAVVENPSIRGIEILGTGGESPVATLAATPSAASFGSTTVGSTKTVPVTLTNVGGSGAPSLAITATSVTGAQAAQFADGFADGTPVTLAPGQSTSLAVTFSPSATGAASASLQVANSGATDPLVVPLSGTGTSPGTGPISFGKSTVGGGLAVSDRPTALEFGPDGRLYVAYSDGTIRVATVSRDAANQYASSAVQTITALQSIPNHDDDGSLNPDVDERLVTGIDVAGTAANPVIYVVSSDPRIGSPSTGDLGMDTNSGVLSKLTWTGSTWQKQDLVRGLPRSKEEHSVQGVHHIAADNTVLLNAGGQTNAGAPSDNFQQVPEYALSAAILVVDLDAIGSSTYDLPTLDDEDRAGTSDANDPFGGNDGKNQAKLVPGGPVQIWASGLRNAYDGVMTSTGFYTIDNGSNASWGGPPQGEGPAGTCTDPVNNAGTTETDTLHRITAPGYYGGHPNPTRGNMANTFNASNPQSPVSSANPVECDWRANSEKSVLASFPTSTNGLDQYTTGNFGGAMAGDLIAAGWGNNVYRVDLDAGGTQGTPSVLFSNVGGHPLDVVAGASTDPFPGTIWVADYSERSILVFEPGDYDGGGGPSCTGADGPLDEDGDGFTNHDEIVNGTDPCSAADVPSDADGDDVSDLLDTDDDNDAIADVDDPFALDPQNGLSTPIPLDFPWDPDSPGDGGILGLGLTGSMTNGSTTWQQAYDLANMTIIGAAGVVTVDELPNGTAQGAANSQLYGLQVGVDARPSSTGAFEASTSLVNPFGLAPPQPGQSFGLQVGTGTQDDHVKVVAAGDGGGQLQLVKEVGGTAQVLASTALAMPGPAKVDVFLWVDPATGVVQASYTTTTGGVTSPRTLLGSASTVPTSWFAQGLAVGLIGTSGGAATPVSASWDFLKVLDAPTPPSATNGATLVATPSGTINASTYNNGSYSLTNTSTTSSISSVAVDLSTAVLPDMVFDPTGAAGDTTAKDLQVNSPGGTGYTGHTLGGAHADGYDDLTMIFDDFGPGETMTFSIDIDPTSIRGTAAPGPGESGSVSGLEMVGATVTVTYSDGTSQTGRMAGIPDSVSGSRLVLAPGAAVAPTLQLLGLANGSSTNTAAQTLRVSGTPGTTVQVLQAEAGLFVEGGGFDVDPLESNSLVGVTWRSVPIPVGGQADVPVTLTRTGIPGGYNHFLAVVDGAPTGTLSNHLLVYRDG